MPQINGAKLYVAAVFAAAFAMRATIGDAPLSADDAKTVGWVLNGVVTGLGLVIGPEIIDGVKGIFGKLGGKSE